MKIIFKLNSVNFLSVIFLITAAVPIFVLALPLDLSGAMASTTTQIGKSQNFCQNADFFMVTEDQKFVAMMADYEKAKINRVNAFNKKYADDDSKTQMARVVLNAKTDKELKDFLMIAKTDAEKVSVVNFSQSVKAATTIRRNAIDAAMKSFRDSLDQAVNKRKSDFSDYLATFKNSIDASMIKARADCANGLDQNVVEINTKNIVKAVRKQFSDSVAKLDNINTAVNLLTKTEKSAFDKAQQNFLVSVSKAKVDLQKAFNE